MDEVWKAIVPPLVEQLLPLVVTAIGIFASWALNSLRRKLDSEAATGALDSVERVVKAVVAELDQTLVPQIREASEDGVITDAERAELLATAKTKVLAALGKHGAKEVTRYFGDLDGFVLSLIEAKVRQARVEGGDY